MTPLKQQISLVPFSIEHWYSPYNLIFKTPSLVTYKRRRFENRSDQTFCILLIRDVLSVIESYIDSNSDFRINLDPEVRRISVPKSWIHSSASFISPSLIQIGCWLYENWENREMLKNVGKSPNPQWRRKWKTGIHEQIRIITKSQPLLEGHLLPGPAKFGRRPFPRSSVILFTEWYRTSERMTEDDHITPALLTEVIIIIIIILCYRPSDRVKIDRQDIFN